MLDLMTVPEAAEQLRVDDSTIRRWIKEGKITVVVLPHVNARQAYRIKRETLENFAQDYRSNYDKRI